MKKSWDRYLNVWDGTANKLSFIDSFIFKLPPIRMAVFFNKKVNSNSLFSLKLFFNILLLYLKRKEKYKLNSLTTTKTKEKKNEQKRICRKIGKRTQREAS